MNPQNLNRCVRLFGFAVLLLLPNRGDSAASADEPKAKPAATPQQKKNPRLNASRMRRTAIKLLNAQPDESDVDVAGVGELPVAIEVLDEVGEDGDVARLPAASRRAVQLCVVVRPRTKPGDKTPPAVLRKYATDKLESPANVTKTHTVKTSIPLPPGEYEFQAFVCDPRAKTEPQNPVSRFPWVAADDSFIPGRVLVGQTYRLRVMAAAATNKKAK